MFLHRCSLFVILLCALAWHDITYEHFCHIERNQHLINYMHSYIYNMINFLLCHDTRMMQLKMSKKVDTFDAINVKYIF